MAETTPLSFFFNPDTKLALPVLMSSYPIKLGSSEKKKKGPTLREQQVSFWRGKEPLAGFKTLLKCLVRLDLYRFVNKDIRRTLFDYIVVYDPPFFKTNLEKREKTPVNHELIFDRAITIPAGTLKCVHISVKFHGRDFAKYRLAFWITDKKLADFIMRTENALVVSKRDKLYSDFKKSIIQNSTTVGWTLFYDFSMAVGHLKTVDFIGYEVYTKIEKVSLLRHSSCNKHEVCTSRPHIVTVGMFIDFPLELVITGLVNIKIPKSGPDKPESRWSKMAYRLDILQ